MKRVSDLVLQLDKQHPGWTKQQIADEVQRQIPGSKTTPASVSSILSQSRTRAPWPSWPEPSECAMVHVAHSAAPLVRFLHPDIIAAIADDNRSMSCEWSSRLAALGVDPMDYLWDGSACTFPGVRRRSGEKDKGADCLKVDPDGNTYPKHLWAFTLTGERFRREGPKGYNLAHLFDHKAGDGRFRDESLGAPDGGKPPNLHGLFTSAANTTFVPDAFKSLTDSSPGFRRLLLHRAAQLYGSSCRLLPPPLKLKGDDDPVFTPDAFDWAQPEGTNAGIDGFLAFRRRCIAELLDTATRR